MNKFSIDMGEHDYVPHAALSDAIWQAKYIATCLNKFKELD